jgi:hypothetical protein
MFASHEHRQYLRYGVRTCAGPEHEAVRMGEPINRMTVPDLEALFELIFGVEPRKPANYRPRH